MDLSRICNLSLSWRRPLSYRNQSINLLRKSMDWFLYDNGLRYEKVNWEKYFTQLNIWDSEGRNE